MKTLMDNIKAFMQDEEGLTVVEYVVGAGLLVAGLAGIFDGFIGVLGDQLDAVFTTES